MIWRKEMFMPTAAANASPMHIGLIDGALSYYFSLLQILIDSSRQSDGSLESTTAALDDEGDKNDGPIIAIFIKGI
jgi:hypothetical protein